MRYKIKDMGRGFDGLTVEGVMACGLLQVRKITNDHVVFGDRNVSFPVPEKCLYIADTHLDEIHDEAREYDHKNPFGKEEAHYRVTRGNFELIITRFEDALTATLVEGEKGKSRTVYSQNYLQYIDLTEETIMRLFTTGDLDDLVFELRKLKEQETE